MHANEEYTNAIPSSTTLFHPPFYNKPLFLNRNCNKPQTSERVALPNMNKLAMTMIISQLVFKIKA